MALVLFASFPPVFRVGLVLLYVVIAAAHYCSVVPAPDGRSYKPVRSRTDRRRRRHIAGPVHRASRNGQWGRGRHPLALSWLDRPPLLLLVPPSVTRTGVQTTCSSSRSNSRPKQRPARRPPTGESSLIPCQNAG